MHISCGKRSWVGTEDHHLPGQGAIQAPGEKTLIGRRRLTQVFKYLEALNQHRNPARRQIDEQPWVLRLLDLPNHPAISRGAIPSDVSSSPLAAGNAFLLRVRRPTTTLPPSPPAWLREWLVGGWQEPSGFVRVHETRNERDEHGQTVITRFDDDPTRRPALEHWQRTWDEWAINERPARAAMAMFERFYELHGRIQREAERLELVIGDGLLSWRRDDGTVHHPILLLRVQLEFEPAVPEFRVVEADRGPELYSPLFHSMPDVEGRVIAGLKSELEVGGFHPLGGQDTSGFLKSLAVRLSPRGRFTEDGPVPSEPDTELSIRRDPLVFLRSRTTGFATAVEGVLQDLKSRPDLPESLLHIVGVEASDGTEGGERQPAPLDAGDGRNNDVLLSKPANMEQVRIAQRLERHGSVLVQGPPGTGKTHTIANLIGHLLAQGQTVLVTAHTTKALRVLREHVVERLRPLCVAVLESDTESRRQLESAVDSIVHRLSVANVNELEAEAQSLETIRRGLSADIQATQRQLVEARNDEYRDVVVAGQAFAPSEAARHVAQGAAQGWIPGNLRAGEPLSLSDDEIRELYATNTRVSPQDEQELRAGLPDPEDLLNPDLFDQLTRERAELTTADRVSGSEYWRERAVESPEALALLAEQSTEAVKVLAAEERWKVAAAEAGCEGEASRQVWETLCRLVDSVRDDAARVAEPLVRFAPMLAAEIGIEEQLSVFEEIIAHLDSGGRLSRFTLLRRRTWNQTLDGVRIADAAPTRREHFEALRAQAKLKRSRAELYQRWDRQVASLGAPRAADLGDDLERVCSQYTPMIRECLGWHDHVWLPTERALKDAGFDWNLFLSRQPPIAAPHAALRRLRDTVLGKLQTVLVARANALRSITVDAAVTALHEGLRRSAPAGSSNGVVGSLLESVVRMDAASYRAAFDRLVELVSKRKVAERREVLLRQLGVVAPDWADAVRHRRNEHGADLLPGSPSEAWLWRQLREELQRRDRTSLQALQERLDQLGTELRRITAEVIDRRAWAAQVNRTSLRHQQALVGWLDVVRRIGKGTGKRVSVLRHEATRLMNDCRGAVPVWIMPLNRVVDNFDPQTTRFDVVIIDEASQSDVMALIALYLGRKTIVVGDHEQVSPAAVGQDLGVVQGLMTEHLASVPNAVLYDGRLSVYDLARQSFGGTIVLVEHFRCVPDVIQFSNTLSYDGKIKPLREASSAAVRPATVAYRVEGSGTEKVNPTEVLAVASLIAAACEQPEYAGATFGAISLVGEEQALEIERVLRNRLAPDECERRRLLCGNAAQFQGDERDVVFLSLVDSSRDGQPLAMRDTPMFRQRFNVAASRARDQLWVVHSLDPELNLKAGDLRRRLIEHATDPTALTQRMAQREVRVESEFEREVMRRLIAEGYDVHPQWQVGHFRIDLVVAGGGKRLAVECDGDRFHPSEKLHEDLERQAVLERLGWTFVRIRGSRFFREPDAAMEPVFAKLRALGIPPAGAAPTQGTCDERGHGELLTRVIRRGAEIRALWEDDPIAGRVAAGARVRQVRGRAPQASRPEPKQSLGDKPLHTEATSRGALSENKRDDFLLQAEGATSTTGRESVPAKVWHPLEDTASSPIKLGPPVHQANRVTSAENRPQGVRRLLRGKIVCRQLPPLDASLSAPRCIACGAEAEIAIDSNEGVVVACHGEGCERLERVDEGILQRLADHLCATCYACGGPLRSLRGHFGNYLKCSACGTNNSWWGVSERVESGIGGKNP
jgi:very-short-patch-repair endonuclease